MDDALTFEIEADELELFLQEVNEHLQTLEGGILSLEAGLDQETLGATFRAAHTLKAVAGAIGHQRMAQLTHALETIFDQLREGALGPAPGLVDDLLSTVDALRLLRDEVPERRRSDVALEVLLDRLAGLGPALAGMAADPAAPAGATGWPAAPTAEQLSAAQAAQHAGLAVFEVVAEADPDGFAPGARLLQAALAAAEAGQVLAQRPTELELLEDRHAGVLWLLLATQHDHERISALLADVSELREARVTAYQARPAGAPLTTSAARGRALSPDKTVRISIERLDVLMDMVGELVTDRTRLAQIEATLRGSYGKGEHIGVLNDTIAHLGRVITQLQAEVMQARMLPIAQLFDKFPRLVRDVARAAGKEVQLTITGEDTELDRSIIEAIGDPLMHVLRNAVDHGVEPPEERLAAGKPRAGTIAVSAEHFEGQIIIAVKDDGRGIDPQRTRAAAVRAGLLKEEEAARLSDDEAVSLIFQPGISTAEALTTTSGRGVGLDVVRANMGRVGGVVVVDSAPGRGTAFRLTLPLTLAIMQTMLVQVRDDVYAIPMRNIVESIYLGDARLSSIRGQPAIAWREQVLPLIELREYFPNPARVARQAGKKAAIVIVSWGALQAGLLVDSIIGKQEIVVKPFGRVIGTVPGLSGCATMGDGHIALILDVPGVINLAIRLQRSEHAS